MRVPLFKTPGAEPPSLAVRRAMSDLQAAERSGRAEDRAAEPPHADAVA